MSADFRCVKYDHVALACRRAIEDGVPAGRQARSTFVTFEGQCLPAKYVLGLAYELATGQTLSPNDYTGGFASGTTLEHLGFQVLHRGSAPPARSSKKRLLDALRSRFGEVASEKKFPWLQVPVLDALTDDLARIRNALIRHRGFDSFDTPGHALRCDYFLPGASMIVEVDERQHFTSARALALRNYAPGIKVGFDLEFWITECERIAATDSSPPHRDEQRAYYDSTRDLLALKQGIEIIRIAETTLSKADGVEHAIEMIARSVPTGLGGPHVSRGTGTVSVATVCVDGKSVKSTCGNQGRIDLLRSITEKIEAWNPTVLLFPGGYFHLPVHIEPLHLGRVRQLGEQPFSGACQKASAALGATVVAGVDTPPRGDSEFAFDQLCVAWSGTSILGIGRKIFPTKQEAEHLVIYPDDIAIQERLAPIGTANQRALLCACYDMFGCTETAHRLGPRSRNIRRLSRDGMEELDRKADRRTAASLISNGVHGWEDLVRQASIGLAAIHNFNRSGQGSGKVYWQRHGIQKASERLGGRMAFGAAHFFNCLPVDREKAVLAAKNGQRISPTQSVIVESGGQKALARLFVIDPD
jgi:hypothetical protein